MCILLWLYVKTICFTLGIILGMYSAIQIVISDIDKLANGKYVSKYAIMCITAIFICAISVIM